LFLFLFLFLFLILRLIVSRGTRSSGPRCVGLTIISSCQNITVEVEARGRLTVARQPARRRFEKISY
ncbi:MAG: hypothetical protein ACI8Y4_002676, partial [Candidatus Poriferisodalaceae bacterium]